ncbi:alpha/beta hydrolase [Streptomyces nanshensis]|uniref:alpha/beta hydrolase n=1 Tax=Streptomyces nanshensis TaxID=518642 RepID=UPI0009A061A3|nr:alpha/beta hydrolase [Streptomyces nanshensis]
MTSFPALSNPLSGSALPHAGAPGTAFWRTVLALAVVLVLLATTGWTAIRDHDAAPGPYAADLIAWKKDSAAGRQLPDPQGKPGAVAGFFRSLTPGQQQRLADRHPLVVGNLGGAPVGLRYRANHEALTQARDVERERMRDQRLTDDGRRIASERMHRFESLLQPGRQILAFDPTGRGRAAEVFGDLGRAQRVSVVVPGVDTDLLTFEKSDRPYSAPAGMARALQDRQRTAAPHTATATIAWADYTAPTGLGVDAASGNLAADGAQRLRDFVRGLHSPHIALFCHSYGSVVCGDAADRLPSRVTDIAVSGSPGMRVDHADDLGTRANIWAVRDEDDWIADVPHMEVGGLGHGADPVSPGFGARRLSAQGALGHTGYYVPGTRSLDNFAGIATGSYETVSCATSDPGCVGSPSGRTL